MTVLASIISMVVEKKNVSSFRDGELAALPQRYRACMGWRGGGRETNDAKSVQESLSAAWLDSQDGHGRRGCTFSGRIRATEPK